MRSILLTGAALALFGCQSAPGGVTHESAAASAPPAAFAPAPIGESRAASAPARDASARWDPILGEMVVAMHASHARLRRVILQNIANVDTPGYKRWFAEIASDGVVDVEGEVFEVPRVVAVRRVFTTGCLEITERALDVAIDGDGFFAVRLRDGSIGYTRNGSFQINADGALVTSRGELLVPNITIPVDTLEISIDVQGLVSGRTASAPDAATEFGQLTTHRFVNPSGLRFEQGVFRPSEQSGDPTTGRPGRLGLGWLKQGFVERSNVELERELMNLQLLEKRQESIARVLRHLGMVAP